MTHINLCLKSENCGKNPHQIIEIQIKYNKHKSELLNCCQESNSVIGAAKEI